MPTHDPNDLDRIDQEIRINELKAEAEELAGGEMTVFEAHDMPPGMAEAFWRNVVEYEKAPLTSPFQKLLDASVELPDPDTLTDEQLTAKLWEVIERMAAMRMFLYQTNHLSDRELYAHLWEDSLHEVMTDVPYGSSGAYVIDILGGCSEEDIQLQMKYYADEDERQRWHQDWPDDVMPPHEDPPFDRDRSLPKAEY